MNSSEYKLSGPSSISSSGPLSESYSGPSSISPSGPLSESYSRPSSISPSGPLSESYSEPSSTPSSASVEESYSGPSSESLPQSIPLSIPQSPSQTIIPATPPASLPYSSQQSSDSVGSQSLSSNETSVGEPSISNTPSFSEQSISNTPSFSEQSISNTHSLSEPNDLFYDKEIQPQPIEEEQPQEMKEEEQQPQPIEEEEQQQSIEEEERELTPEEYIQLDQKEKSIRSKILNQPQPCQKKQISPSDPYVEKVQLKTPLIENEQSISNLLKSQIPQAFLYFQPLIETQPLSIGSITECENTDITTDQEQLIEAKYKSVGNKTLEEYLQAQIKTPKQANKFIQILVNAHLQLLDSVQLLQSANPPIVHFHITPQTILYDEINSTPVLTDFRLAFTKTTIENQEESQELFPPYENNPGWPIEVFLLSHLLETQQKPIEELIASFNNPTKQPTSIETIKNKTPIELKQTFLSWDTYSINQVIYSFLTTSDIPLNFPFMRTYVEVLSKELTAEPIERTQITALQTNIRNIFKSIPKKEYLDFLDALIH